MELVVLTVAACVAWVYNWPLWAEVLLTVLAAGVAFAEVTRAD